VYHQQQQQGTTRIAMVMGASTLAYAAWCSRICCSLSLGVFLSPACQWLQGYRGCWGVERFGCCMLLA
jgi:hypothetical protein